MHTLLLADDHVSMRAALRRIIESDSQLLLLGEAVNLGETLARAAQLRPSILLLDLHMPDQLEFDPAFVKDQLSACCGCVLAMSVWQDSESDQLAQSYGAARVLDKANFASEFRQAIQSLPASPFTLCN
jgi:two-component system, NarL family, response regulator NreC